MARSSDLMGLGLPHLLALRIGDDPVSVTCQGTSAGSANQLPPSSIVWVNSSNSGSGVKLSQVGGDPGCLLGDDTTIVNLLGATIAIYASNNAAGSAVTLIGNNTTQTGTTGVSLISNAAAYFVPITPSTWLFIKSSV